MDRKLSQRGVRIRRFQEGLVLRAQNIDDGPPVISFFSPHPVKMGLKLLYAFVLVWMLSTSQALAQILGVSDTTATPVAGVPHDYLVGLGEIVSPANGSLSIRLKAPAPHERGVNWPVYLFIWDSASQYSLSPTWITGTNGNGGFAEMGNLVGSSPALIVANVLDQSITLPSGGSPPTTTTYYCDTASGYVFIDPDGGRHALGLLDAQSVPSQNANWNCGQFNLGSNYTLGGDEKYKGSLTVSSTTFPPTGSVVDTHGNLVATYTAAANGSAIYQGVGAGYGSLGPFPYAIATTPGAVVEDTNGNYWNTTGRTWTVTQTSTGYDLVMPGPSLIPGTSSSYIFTTEAPVNASFSVASTAVNSLSAGNFCQVTSIPMSSGWTGALPGVMKTIEQPDGLSYSFQYDPVYGMIDQITYPTGATVSYTWSVIPNMEGVQYRATHWSGGQGGLCAFVYGWPAITKRILSYNGQQVQEQDFQYNTVWPAAGGSTSYEWTSKTTTVTTKDLIRGTTFNTTYTYSPVLPPPTTDATSSWGDQGFMPVEKTIQYYDTNGALLKTVNKVWQDVSLLTAECETLPNGQTSGTFYTYEADPGMSSALNPNAQMTDLPTDVAEWDYSSTAFSNGCVRPSSSPTRETKTVYWSFSPTPLFPITSILDRPKSVQILGNNVLLSETDYAYDEVAPTCISPAPFGHDETNYGCSVSSPRGNPTTVTRMCFVGSTNCTNSITKYVYDTAGNVLSVTDGCGNSTCADMTSGIHSTSYSFADNYTTDNGTCPGNTYAYLTKITRPPTSANHISTYKYGCEDGRLRSETDENSNATTFCYTTGGCSGSSFDSFFRLTGVNHPDAGQETISYSDAGPNPTVTDTNLENSGGTQVTKLATYDEYGHAIQTEVTTDPAGPDYVTTAYDGLGRVYQQSNPYRSGTPSLSTFYYDALGRNIETVEQDGSVKQSCYDGVVSSPAVANCSSSILGTATTGSWVDSTDERGSHWQQVSDALGRLTRVLEPNGNSQAPSMQTDYSYDALGNLLSVSQKGVSGTDTARTRSFMYDSLSRLIQGYNPETGWLCYGTTPSNALPNGSNCTPGYDANGNLSSKTDARGVTTNSLYDVLNRVLNKSYSDSITSSSCYQYDSSSVANGIGRLGSEWTQAGTCSSSPPSGYLSLRAFGAYDSRGRVLTEQQCVSGYCTSASMPSTPTPNCTALSGASGLQYCYDFAGNLLAYSNGVTTQTAAPYPQQAILFAQTFDAAGRLATVNSSWSDSNHPGSLFNATGTGSAAAYTPFNSLATWQLGANLWTSKHYDVRLRNCWQMSATGLSTLQQASLPAWCSQ